jgi:hypothetical protein
MISMVPNTRQAVTINGIEALGNCWRETDGVSMGRPYVEGASLYGSGNAWSIVFAAKPSVTPKECAMDVTAPNSVHLPLNPYDTHEVIAWASATSPQGPYTYQGVVICSSPTEWTNQATLANIKGANGKVRSVIIYHDSPANNPSTPADESKQRRLHAECRFTNADGSVVGGVFRQPADAANGYNDCLAGERHTYRGWHMRQPQYPNLPTIIQAPSNGAPLDANRYAVGPWERYRKRAVAVNGPYWEYNIQALSNGKMLCTGPDMNTPIHTNCPQEDIEDNPYALWRYISITGGKYLLYSPTHGRYVGLGPDGLLYANVGSPHGAAELTELYMGGNPL